MSELFLPLFITFFIAELLLDLWLNRLNIRHVRNNINLPTQLRDAIDGQQFQKSRTYTITNVRFANLSSVISFGITAIVLFSGILPWLADSWSFLEGLSAGVFFLWSLTLIQSVLSLPLSWYRTFKIETRYGFNKTTPKLFLNDLLKTLIISSVIGIPLMYALLGFIDSTGPWWWLITAGFLVGFQMIMMIIYPLLIAPLFNKFTPLKEGELKDELLSLAERLQFSAQDIFVMDGSRRSKHSNAYFTGFGKMRRIVLYDTLIDQLSIQELVAVLAHEIGHYKKRHVFKMVTVSTFMTTLTLWIFSQAIDWQPLYSAFGFNEPSHATGLYLFFTAFSTFTFIFSPLIHILSRKHEYEADAYAKNAVGSGKPLCSALTNMAEKNLSNLTPHPLYSFFHYSHPTVLERINKLK